MSTCQLHKKERLCSHYLIDRLFKAGGGSRSLTAFPLRMVYRTEQGGDGTASILISVPKRQFKHAVDRNRVKRQVREAYRNNKRLLQLPQGISANIAFIWLDSRHYPSAEVTTKVCNLLSRMSERI